jgi:hypothetical protein
MINWEIISVCELAHNVFVKLISTAVLGPLLRASSSSARPIGAVQIGVVGAPKHIYDLSYDRSFDGFLI